MTRDRMKRLIMDIIVDIEPYVHDDSGLYIPESELERVAEELLKLWEFGHTWEIKK